MATQGHYQKTTALNRWVEAAVSVNSVQDDEVAAVFNQLKANILKTTDLCVLSVNRGIKVKQSHQ